VKSSRQAPVLRTRAKYQLRINYHQLRINGWIGNFYYVLDGYYRVDVLKDPEACLRSGYGFVMSFPLYRSVLSKAVGDVYFEMPADKEMSSLFASHSVFVAGSSRGEIPGRDQAPGGGYWICKGSQGRRRGDKGYFYVPFAFSTRGRSMSGQPSDSPLSLVE
jgi:C1A family cysteine protease